MFNRKDHQITDGRRSEATRSMIVLSEEPERAQLSYINFRDESKNLQKILKIKFYNAEYAYV